MIEEGKKYRILKPVHSKHVVGVGDEIEVYHVSWIGVKAFGISMNDYNELYDGILMFNGDYTKEQYWEMIESCLEEVK